MHPRITDCPGLRRGPNLPGVLIREFVDRDWSQVWPIIEEVIRAQETFPYDPAMTAEQSYGMWVEAAPGRTVVAVDGERVLGTAKMGTNRPGPGAHVSTASFMVAADARGRGVGTALCRDALTWARQQGYAGMQFNAVAESNVRRCGCTGGRASRWSAPCRARSATPPSAGSACT